MRTVDCPVSRAAGSVVKKAQIMSAETRAFSGAWADDTIERQRVLDAVDDVRQQIQRFDRELSLVANVE